MRHRRPIHPRLQLIDNDQYDIVRPIRGQKQPIHGRRPIQLIRHRLMTPYAISRLAIPWNGGYISAVIPAPRPSFSFLTSHHAPLRHSTLDD